MAEMIKTTVEGSELHLSPVSDLVAGSAAAQREEMLAALNEPAEAVVLDLSAVGQVDSLGISLIVGLFKTCEAKGLTFSVVGINENIMRVFKLFKLPQFFSVKGV
jgi:anti-anti-sigma factor